MEKKKDYTAPGVPPIYVKESGKLTIDGEAELCEECCLLRRNFGGCDCPPKLTPEQREEQAARRSADIQKQRTAFYVLFFVVLAIVVAGAMFLKNNN